jgi:hypothetical protein
MMAGSSGVRASSAASPALQTAPASKDVVSVWYRSSEGCPDGGVFIELLHRLGRAASLARVGDRIDFVVTVAHGERESSGHLERQNRERTVAIRDVSAATCEEVAEVLSLSLDLALQPGADPQAEAPPPPSTSDGWQQRLGGQLTLETGLARTVLPGAALFIELGPALKAWSLRLSFRGAYAEPDVAVPLNIGLLASRLEGCWAWAVGPVSLGPCAGMDVGLVFAESSRDNGRSDVGLWSSAVAHARASRQFGRLVAFVRYRFSAQTGDEVTGSAPVGVEAALGASFRF